MGPEAKIQAKVTRWVRVHGGRSYKFHEFYNRSAPDRLFVMPSGAVVWIEFKAPGKHPTPAQDHELSKLAKLHQHVRWFDDAQKAIDYLRRFL